MAAVEVRQTLGAVEREFARALREGIVFRAVVLAVLRADHRVRDTLEHRATYPAL